MLNRLHKPLGFDESAKMRFVGHPTATALRISPATAKLLSHEHSANVERIFMYSDSTAPSRSTSAMIAYLQRLAILATLTIE